MPGHSCAGEPVIYDAIQAVRDWLAANTLTVRPEAQTDELRRMLAQAEVSDDDLELDEEDMDEEMIEVRPLLPTCSSQKPCEERRLDILKQGRVAMKHLFLCF